MDNEKLKKFILLRLSSCQQMKEKSFAVFSFLCRFSFWVNLIKTLISHSIKFLSPFLLLDFLISFNLMLFFQESINEREISSPLCLFDTLFFGFSFLFVIRIGWLIDDWILRFSMGYLINNCFFVEFCNFRVFKICFFWSFLKKIDFCFKIKFTGTLR